MSHTLPQSPTFNSFIPTIFSPAATHIPSSALKTTEHTPQTALSTPTSSPQIVLHVGVGLPGGYTLESCARESGYWRRDVDEHVPAKPTGTELSDEEYEAEKHKPRDQRLSGKGRFLNLDPCIDLERVVEAVKKSVEPTPEEKERVMEATRRNEERRGGVEDVGGFVGSGSGSGSGNEGVVIEISDNAGLFLCEYILRTSLLEVEKLVEMDGKKRVVAFLHVPLEELPYGVGTGRKVVEEVVRGLVGAFLGEAESGG